MTEFEYLRLMVQPKSTCQKKAVAAGCWVGERFVTAANYCEYTGQVCGRIDLPTGARPDLCESEHAEIRLLDELKKIDLSMIPNVVWIYGHKHICHNCAEALHEFGIKEIRIREH
jgi:deoxycytidylate deaminase